ncbi:MAG: respiratory nitrate reductase subunit gamma [Intrasporangium sp.]|uniref:respiratory nitrate reductase subunit gamma n=1 Tax=Intrasporangium sp. TaxID=1925024 RepID=UPI002647F5C3|nr:respiratory nitrate reductase subunit gamma [Intrasporangium sp.]MDN5795544.1 respiratory nitrate reductase subunit gamma [Intrasporangium sp.]
MSATWAYFWWVILPYIAMAVFIIGHIWRWRYDQYGWTSYSTELQEHKRLKWGAPLFHYGTFAAIGGHVIGILIPKQWVEAIGINEHAYHLFSAVAGLIAAALVIIGVTILAARRLFVPRVRATTSPVDWVALILLGIMVGLGIATTAINAPLGFDYRETISVWFRGLFAGDANIALAQQSPVIFQVHAIAAWLLFLIWPFTRLVHAWSYPLWYLWRPYVVYRAKKAGPPAESGTGGRKWRKIGVRY